MPSPGSRSTRLCSSRSSCASFFKKHLKTYRQPALGRHPEPASPRLLWGPRTTVSEALGGSLTIQSPRPSPGLWDQSLCRGSPEAAFPRALPAVWQPPSPAVPGCSLTVNLFRARKMVLSVSQPGIQLVFVHASPSVRAQALPHGVETLQANEVVPCSRRAWEGALAFSPVCRSGGGARPERLAHRCGPEMPTPRSSPLWGSLLVPGMWWMLGRGWG